MNINLIEAISYLAFGSTVVLIGLYIANKVDKNLSKKIKLHNIEIDLKKKLKNKKFEEAYKGELEIINCSSKKAIEKHLDSMKARWTWLDWLEHWWHIYFWNKVRYIPKEIKWFIQRGQRGYSDSDIWDFCDYLSDVISKGIRQLIKIQNGYPSQLTEKKWKNILRKIARTFELYDVGRGRQLTNKECKEFEEGWKLFKEYFENLWD